MRTSHVTIVTWRMSSSAGGKRQPWCTTDSNSLAGTTHVNCACRVTSLEIWSVLGEACSPSQRHHAVSVNNEHGHCSQQSPRAAAGKGVLTVRDRMTIHVLKQPGLAYSRGQPLPALQAAMSHDQSFNAPHRGEHMSESESALPQLRFSISATSTCLDRPAQ